FINPSPPPHIYTLSLHDALPISLSGAPERPPGSRLAGRCSTPSRDTVVLVAMTASMPRAATRSAIASIPDSSTSGATFTARGTRSEEHTSELQSRGHLVCRLLLE